MNRTQKIVAQRSMRYGTRMLRAGDVFEAKDRDARLLVAIGRAKPVEVVIAATVIEPPTEEERAKIRAIAPSPTLADALRAEYRDRTGKDADGRWGVLRLTEEVSKLRNAV